MKEAAIVQRFSALCGASGRAELQNATDNPGVDWLEPWEFTMAINNKHPATTDNHGLELGVLAIALAIVGLFALMTVTAQVMSPGDSLPVTAQLNAFNPL